MVSLGKTVTIYKPAWICWKTLLRVFRSRRCARDPLTRMSEDVILGRQFVPDYSILHQPVRARNHTIVDREIVLVLASAAAHDEIVFFAYTGLSAAFRMLYVRFDAHSRTRTARFSG